jgi:hypothetical protein
MIARIIGVPAALIFAAVGAAERYDGDAYALDGETLLFHESHFLAESNGLRERIVLYRCPDGRAFARKHVRESADPQTPDFDLQDARLGYREGVRTSGAGREAYVRRGAEAPEQSAPLSIPADGVIDTGFDAYVQRHWSELSGGGTRHFAFLVPSRRSFYTFKLSSIADAADSRTLSLRLSLGSWWGFLLPHIDVTYDRATRRLLSYEGLTNIRDGALKNLNAHVVFPAAPAPADPQAIEAARAEPLAVSCEAVSAPAAK